MSKHHPPGRPSRVPPNRPRIDTAPTSDASIETESFAPEREEAPQLQAETNERPLGNSTIPVTRSRFGAYLGRHSHAALSSLGRLWRNKLSSLFTIGVIAIALALPAALGILGKRALLLADHWNSAARVSAFFRADTSEAQARDIARQVSLMPNIKTVEYISPEQALTEYSQRLGLSNPTEGLDGNPLPGMLMIEPSVAQTDAAAVEAIGEALRKVPGVDFVELDSAWLQRLYALVNIGRQATVLVAGLLGLGVLLVIGNTIRLEIFNRRDEVVISKLIGATDAFIRRPFLYTGFWLGLLGAITGWLIVFACQQTLQAPINQLAGLYQTEFNLLPDLLLASGPLLATGVLLGLGGAWFSVSKHLRDLEPV